MPALDDLENVLERAGPVADGQDGHVVRLDNTAGGVEDLDGPRRVRDDQAEDAEAVRVGKTDREDIDARPGQCPAGHRQLARLILQEYRNLCDHGCLSLCMPPGATPGKDALSLSDVVSIMHPIMTAEPRESSLTDTRAAELKPIELPGEGEMSALAELIESLGKTSNNARAQAAIEKGVLKDLAPCFDPDTRQDPPGRHNSISAKIVDDFSAVVSAFDAVAVAIGYKPPAPSHRRYAGPELRLRYCQIERSDLSMQQMPWPMDLCGCRFNAPGIFMGATFGARSSFEHSVFEGGADFGLARFQAEASFSGVSFTGPSSVSATFAGVTFCQHADFDLTRFSAAVQFDYATFEGRTRFFRAKFRGTAGFAEAKFHDQAQFEFAAFGDQAEFNGVVFDKAPDFHGAAFENAVNFSAADFDEYLDLRTAAFGKDAVLSLADLRVRASSVLGGNVRLRSSQLCKWRWWPPGADSLIEADSPRKVKASAKRKMRAAIAADADRAEQARREYRKTVKNTAAALATACTQYGVLEENFRVQGDPDSRGSEDFCHFRYHDLWRQTHRKPYSPLCWANWFFLKICFGYGVYVLRILTAGLGLLVLFACIYATNGLWLGDDDWDVETTETVVVPDPSGGPDIEQSTRVCLSQLAGLKKWGCALYFSTTTFSTVGFGDWKPVGGAQAAAATEGLLGVFIMAVFTVSFARKIVR